MSRPRFHLAIPVHDLDEAAGFYGEILGCPRGRSADTWIDWDVFGHQVVTHLHKGAGVDVSNPVDGHDVPVPHVGVIVDPPTFHALAQTLREAPYTFVIEPYVRFEGEPGEQWTMFLLDPSGNALEFKAFAHDDQVFAT
ncbi:MAG: VOC family protein [Actinomycetota bacterium]|nr:VOC family protein [Actinomycetota bacterium]